MFYVHESKTRKVGVVAAFWPMQLELRQPVIRMRFRCKLVWLLHMSQCGPCLPNCTFAGLCITHALHHPAQDASINNLLTCVYPPLATGIYNLLLRGRFRPVAGPSPARRRPIAKARGQARRRPVAKACGPARRRPVAGPSPARRQGSRAGPSPTLVGRPVAGPSPRLAGRPVAGCASGLLYAQRLDPVCAAS